MDSLATKSSLEQGATKSSLEQGFIELVVRDVFTSHQLIIRVGIHRICLSEMDSLEY